MSEGTTSAYLFPGQGSQKPGMGRDLAETFAIAKDTFAEADDALGEALSELCFEGPADTLALTFNAQPAILATSIAALRAAKSEGVLPEASFVAGHSLGEWSALVAAGALDFGDALRLVRLRGQAMQKAVPVGVGSMAAVMGLEPHAVREICEKAQEGQICSPANFNGGGQIVISGHKEAVDRAIALVKAAKKKAIPLKVSAPFHSQLMSPAAEAIDEALAEVAIHAPSVPVVSNVEACPYRGADKVRSLLVAQVTGAVRWEESMQGLVSDGVDTFVEVGYGKVLAGLMRRINKEMEVVPMGSADDMRALAGEGE